MTNTEKLQDAERMGREAFESGKPRAPALNQEFLKKYAAHSMAELMTSYLAGWDEANLSADVPGWTKKENAAMQRARKKETP